MAHQNQGWSGGQATTVAVWISEYRGV